MHLLLIRHAIAVPRETPGIPDNERPLTAEGEAKFREAARGLARVAERPDALLTSPLPRARRTAEIAARAWGGVHPRELPALAGGSFEDLERALRRYRAEQTVALVGHEPHLSHLLARILGAVPADSGVPRTRGVASTALADHLTFRKGGAALVEVPERLSRGGALLWFLPPRVLRAIGGRSG